MLIFRKENANTLVILREKQEKPLYKESTFYRHLADQLNMQHKTDLIPKRMWKDGHLVDDDQFYLVDRKRDFAFIQTDWEVAEINQDYFNKMIPLKLRYYELQDKPPKKQKINFLNNLPTWIEQERNELFEPYQIEYGIIIIEPNQRKINTYYGNTKKEALDKLLENYQM